MTAKQGYTYILSNKIRSVLYIGVTSNLLYRVYHHRIGLGSSFTRKYNIRHPLYYEKYNSIQKAIEREKQLKNWNREWKLELIRKTNPELRDIWEDIVMNARFSHRKS
jgi:putative endonuclease